MTQRLPAWLLALACAPAGAAAESRYVIDQLVVSVNNAPTAEGERIATLKSGDRIELLGRQGESAQVQLPNGRQGWVKASYLSAAPPLQRRLADRIAEVEKLKQDMGRLEAALSAARSAPQPAALPAAPSGAPSAAASANASPVSSPSGGAAAVAGDAPLLLAPAQHAPKLPWSSILAVAVLAAAAGFAAGWRVLDLRIRRKYGGLRIY